MSILDIGEDCSINPSKVENSNNGWIIVGAIIVAVSYWGIINFLVGLV